VRNPTEVPSILQLQRLLTARDHSGFLDAFSTLRTSAPISNYQDFLGALGGEGLCLLLQVQPTPLQLAKRYGELLLNGTLSAPAIAIEQLAMLLNSPELEMLARRAESCRQDHPAPPTLMTGSSSRPAILQVRRVVQIMQMFLGKGEYSDGSGIRRSVYRSQQERTFLRALTLRFPGLMALPNYPFDQIVDLERLGEIDPETRRYARSCRLDAVLINPDEGDPVAAFELDSRHHDNHEARHRDSLKNSLIAAAQIPFFRLRAESSESMSIDEWYALLSDQILPHIDLGGRIRCRDAAYRLIPCNP
jgi:hypothetical protein